MRANRIFVNTESVINSLSAVCQSRISSLAGNRTESQKLASDQDSFFAKKYEDRNIKEVMRKGLRNLYLSQPKSWADFVGLVEDQQGDGIAVYLEQALRQQLTRRRASKPVARLALHMAGKTGVIRRSFAEG